MFCCLFSDRRPLGDALNDTFGIFLAFLRTGAVLAAAGMAFPLMVRAIRLAIEGGPQIRRGGHHDWRQSDLGFLDHYDALAGGRLSGGMVLAFAKAMKEFGATIIYEANIPGQTQTLPSAIYAFLQVPGGDASAVRLLVLSVFISVLALALSEWMARRVVHGTGQ